MPIGVKKCANPEGCRGQVCDPSLPDPSGSRHRFLWGCVGFLQALMDSGPRCCPSDSELALTCALATSWELMEVFLFRLRSTIWNLATRAAGHRLQGTKVDSHGQST
jgi:hypothetical protein